MIQMSTLRQRVRVDGGSSNEPSLSFSSDTNTGLYQPTADHLAAVTNGTERMRITSTGQVGIGTSTPQASLHIHQTDALILPTGTSAQQPAAPVAGMVRYNSQLKILEFYNGTAWVCVLTEPGDIYAVYQTNAILHLDPSSTRSYPGAGSIWYDLSTAQSHATNTNATFSRVPIESFTFNGTNAYFNLQLTNPAGAWVHSISFWMQLDIPQSSLTGRVNPFQIGNVAAISQYSALDIYSNGQCSWYFYSNDTSFTYTFTQGVWYHIVLTYNGGAANATNKKIYANTINIPLSGTSTTPLNIAANALMAIGWDRIRTTAHFPGKIGNFMIYNEVLSAAAILQNYNAHRARYGL